MNYINNVEVIKKLTENLPNTKQRFGLLGSLLLISMCVFIHFLSFDAMQQLLAEHCNLSVVFINKKDKIEKDKNEKEKNEITSTSNIDDDASIITYQVVEDNTPMFSEIETNQPIKNYRAGDILTKLTVNPDSNEDTINWKFVMDSSGNLGWIHANSLKELDGEKINVMNVSATTSYIKKKTKEIMKPGFIIDGLIETSWQEGVNGTGKGEFIHMSFTGEEKISKLLILNGNVITKKKYFENNRLKVAILKFSNGSQQEINFTDEYTLTGINITFDSPIATKWIEIVIEDVYRGSKYNDTCISEIIALR
ncbi:MAG: NADase-type glycan-binding domain-containing protein [Mobilitalea sp.]